MSEAKQIPSVILEAAINLAPHVYLHPDDPYRPCSVDWYLENVSLWIKGGDQILATGDVNPDSLLEAQESNENEDLSLRVQVPDDDWDNMYPGNSTYRGQDVEEDDVPCYYCIREKGGRYYLQYYFFYAYNGGMLASLDPIKDLGYQAHEGDWEYITVVLIPKDGKVLVPAIAYSGHGYITHWDTNSDDSPIAPDELNPITVYSAIHSHASYPSADDFDLKKIPDFANYFLEGTDVTAEGGPIWKTGDNLVQIEQEDSDSERYLTPWANYKGDWGTDRVFKEGINIPVVDVGEVEVRVEGPSGPTTKGYEVDVVGSVEVTYEAQGDESFRCSDEFPNWSIPSDAYLILEVDTYGRKGIPVFSFNHNKDGEDTRWYSNRKGGDCFAVTSENGAAGAFEVYLGTMSPLPPDTEGDDTYSVTVRWSMIKEDSQSEDSGVDVSELTHFTTVGVYYGQQGGEAFRSSDNFPVWDVEEEDNIYCEIELSEGQTEYPAFAVNRDQDWTSGSDDRWYSGLTHGSYFRSNAGSGYSLYAGTVSVLPEGVEEADTYKIKFYKYVN